MLRIEIIPFAGKKERRQLGKQIHNKLLRKEIKSYEKCKGYYLVRHKHVAKGVRV